MDPSSKRSVGSGRLLGCRCLRQEGAAGLQMVHQQLLQGWGAPRSAHWVAHHRLTLWGSLGHSPGAEQELHPSTPAVSKASSHKCFFFVVSFLENGAVVLFTQFLC